MAHFAKLDKVGTVLSVIVVDDSVILDKNGIQQEALGIAFCKSLFGDDTEWAQTSYSSSMRKNYAKKGGIYDAVRDAFIEDQPHPAWVIDEASCQWVAPKTMPKDGKPYTWDDSQQNWIALKP